MLAFYPDRFWRSTIFFKFFPIYAMQQYQPMRADHVNFVASNPVNLHPALGISGTTPPAFAFPVSPPLASMPSLPKSSEGRISLAAFNDACQRAPGLVWPLPSLAQISHTPFAATGCAPPPAPLRRGFSPDRMCSSSPSGNPVRGLRERLLAVTRDRGV